MTSTGRGVRSVATALVLTLVVLGSLFGSDHDFPVGPFRMYATSGRPTGTVRTAVLLGVHDGKAFVLKPERLGLRRAEIEGQYPRFRQDPRLLGTLAAAYERVGVHVEELRLIERVRRIVNRHRVHGSSEHVVADWKRPR
jgi:hypothetical protein